MTKVRKGNRELSVEDGSVDSYIAEGYQIIDARGNVINHGTNTSYSGLRGGGQNNPFSFSFNAVRKSDTK